MRIGCRTLWNKSPEWREWMRWRRVLNTFESNGCLSDSCSDIDGATDGVTGCKCNNFREREKLVEFLGYKQIASGPSGKVWYHPSWKYLVFEYYEYGR